MDNRTPYYKKHRKKTKNNSTTRFQFRSILEHCEAKEKKQQWGLDYNQSWGNQIYTEILKLIAMKKYLTLKQKWID